MSDDLDDLLRELKDSNKDDLPIHPPVERQELDEDSINQYILNNASRLIETGLNSVESLRDVVAQSYDAKEIEAYAILIKSVSDSMDTINKINITNKKIKATKENKQLEIEAKRQLGPSQHNTNVLIATRDEIIKGLINAASNQSNEKVVDIAD